MTLPAATSGGESYTEKLNKKAEEGQEIMVLKKTSIFTVMRLLMCIGVLFMGECGPIIKMTQDDISQLQKRV